MMLECAVDGYPCPTMQCTYVMGELLTAEKYQKQLWEVMRQLQKDFGKYKIEGLKLFLLLCCVQMCFACSIANSHV